MWLVLDHFSRTWIDAAVANAILLSVVVLLVVFTRQPARRILLVQCGVYAALLMFPLVAFDVLPRAYPVDWLLRTGLVPPSLTPEPDPVELIGPTAPGPAGRISPRGRPSASQSEWPAGERLVRVATLLYLAGAGLGLAWFGLGIWGFRRLLDRSQPAGPTTQRVFDELIADLGRAPPTPTLRTSPWLRSPVLGGVTRPAIVVPAELDDEDEEALRLILLHELAHADRGDAWFNALASIAQLLWFFLPHLWWLRAQLRIDQEFLADRKASGPQAERTRYARWLVGLSKGLAGRAIPNRRPDAGSSSDPAHPVQPWGERGFDTPLLQRVAMLLYCPFVVEDRPPRWFKVAVPVAIMLAATTLSTFRILAPVDASVMLREARALDPLVRFFEVPEFVVVPRVTPIVLPLAMPAAFHLTGEVVATPRGLAQLRIADCPLVPQDPELIARMQELPDEDPREYRVGIRREFRALNVAVHRIRDEETPPGPDEDFEFSLDYRLLEKSHWLSITPADQIATIRKLIIRW